MADYKDRYNALADTCDNVQSRTDEALPRAQQFCDTRQQMLTWLGEMEPELRSGGKELTGPEAEEQVQVGGPCI